MSYSHLYKDINALPEELQKQVKDFIDFLKQKTHKTKKNTQRKFGVLKGAIKLSADFDEPLSDFKEYR